MKGFCKVIIVALTGMVMLYACSAQKNTSATNETSIEETINKQRYTFTAQSVFPTEDARFNPRLMFPNAVNNLYQLTAGYDLKITPDSVVAFLPYFGRAFVAPMNPSEGGIKFTSTNFSYKVSKKKGNYIIDIIPKDVKDVRDLYFTITRSGYATLQVLSNNRTPISFYGTIKDNNRQ